MEKQMLEAIRSTVRAAINEIAEKKPERAHRILELLEVGLNNSIEVANVGEQRRD